MSAPSRTLALCLLSLAAGARPLGAQAADPFAGWYAGIGMARVDLRIPGRSLELSGIQFEDVNARADQAGFKIYAGYWIDPHLALEFAAVDLGHADATFSYRVPPAETGTGATAVGASSASISLLAAQPVGRWTLYLRGGVQAWELDCKTQFRPSAGAGQYRELEQKGNAVLLGAGVEYGLRRAWHLRLEGEAQKMGIADARILTLGLTYRF